MVRAGQPRASVARFTGVLHRALERARARLARLLELARDQRDRLAHPARALAGERALDRELDLLTDDRELASERRRGPAEPGPLHAVALGDEALDLRGI